MLAVGVVRGMGENIGVRLVLIVQFVETLEVESRATPEILYFGAQMDFRFVWRNNG
jgi:hypothetical protein